MQLMILSWVFKNQPLCTIKYYYQKNNWINWYDQGYYSDNEFDNCGSLFLGVNNLPGQLLPKSNNQPTLV